MGKKGNPSHCSIFAITEDLDRLDDKGNKLEVLIMIAQKFMDQWEYIKQVEYLKACVEYYGIVRGAYDNTRSELEERDLPRQIMPVVLSNSDGVKSKSKPKMAAQFSKLVEQRRIKLLDDDRFVSQILCVSNNLEAPNSPLGHGDSFISVMLAVGVYFDFFAKDRKMGFSNLGDIQQIFSPSEKRVDLTSKDLPAFICKICKGRLSEILPTGRRKCLKCFTVW